MKKQDYFPRVLIINAQSMYKNDATGITLRSLFGACPKDRIMELYQWDYDGHIEADQQIMSCRMPLKIMPVYYFARKITGKDYKGEPSTILNETANKKKNKKRLIKDAFLLIRGLTEFSPIIIPHTDKTIKNVDNFSPEVIYTLGGSVYINRLALFFSKRYKAQIVIHYMDNWRETAFMGRKFANFLGSGLNYTASKIEERMVTGLTISEKMAREYHKKFGNDYVALMNCIDIKETGTTRHDTLKNHDVIFTYAGGLHLGRRKSLLALESAIKNYNSKRHDKQAHLVVHTSENDRESNEMLFDPKTTNFRPYVPNEKINDVYNKSDVLVHIESFDEKTKGYIKYSISTKIPEYLASGKPILCFAPPDIAVSEYITETQAGIAVKNAKELVKIVGFLSKSYEARMLLGENGIRAAKRNHDKIFVQNTLRKVFVKNLKPDKEVELVEVKEGDMK